jgi:hypothetical protein
MGIESGPVERQRMGQAAHEIVKALIFDLGMADQHDVCRFRLIAYLDQNSVGVIQKKC